MSWSARPAVISLSAEARAAFAGPCKKEKFKEPRKGERLFDIPCGFALEKPPDPFVRRTQLPSLGIESGWRAMGTVRGCVQKPQRNQSQPRLVIFRHPKDQC